VVKPRKQDMVFAIYHFPCSVV